MSHGKFQNEKILRIRPVSAAKAMFVRILAVGVIDTSLDMRLTRKATSGRLAWIARMPERKPIFYDEQRRRWRRTRRVLEITGGLFTLVLIIFIVNVIRNPDLPDILRADTHGTLHAIRSRLKPKSVRQGRKHRVAQLGQVPSNYDPLRAAFYVSWDSTSLASLQAHYHDLDLLDP